MMKTVVLALALLSFAAIPLAAQTASHSTSTTNPAHQSSMTGNDLRGCLSGSKGNYTLVDHQGKAHKVTGDNHLLADDVGHEVDMNGATAAHNVFHDTEITDIASRCWNFSLQ